MDAQNPTYPIFRAWRVLLALVALSAFFVACDSDNGGDQEIIEDSVEPKDTTPDTSDEVDQSTPPDAEEDDYIYVEEGPRELLNGTPVKIGHIIDGDTLDVFVGEKQFKVYTVRLQGISAPECNQAKEQTEYGRRYLCVSDDEYWGLNSREGLVAFAAGKEGFLTCEDAAYGEWCPVDTYERYLAYIEIDGRDLATEMAYQGHALSYTSFYSSKRGEICEAEYAAQDANRGMWAQGSVSAVIDRMSGQTQNWYENHHDWRCEEAMGQ